MRYILLLTLYFIISCKSVLALPDNKLYFVIQEDTIVEGVKFHLEMLNKSNESIAICYHFEKPYGFGDNRHFNYLVSSNNKSRVYMGGATGVGSTNESPITNDTIQLYNNYLGKIDDNIRDFYTEKNVILFAPNEKKVLSFSFDQRSDSLKRWYKLYNNENYFLQIEFNDKIEQNNVHKKTLKKKLKQKGYKLYSDSVLSQKVPIILQENLK